MRVLLDTNVVLDVLLARAPFEEEARQLWEALNRNQIDGYIRASTVTDIFYIARKQTDRAKARGFIQICLDALEVCTVDKQTLQNAVSLAGDDLEDNLQEACAITYGLDAIVTRDKRGFQSANLPVLAPSEVLTQLNAPR